MSTNTPPPARGAPSTLAAGALVLAAALFLLLPLACTHPRGSRLADLCEGDNVVARVALTIDSVATVGGAELTRLKGDSFDIAISLFNQLEPARCPDRSGEANVDIGDLPDELASAASRASTAHWWIEGLSVVVELDRGVRDDNLSLSLPLDGSDGRWTLSRFPGVVAEGRLLRQ